MNRDELIMLQTHPLNQRVFIVGNSSLFEEGITSLLTLEIGLQVSSIKYTNDHALLDHIAQHRPQVIILNESSLVDPMYILELIFSSISLAGLCIIIMRLTDNMVDVYNMSQKTNARKLCKREQVILSKGDDLVAVVRG